MDFFDRNLAAVAGVAPALARVLSRPRFSPGLRVRGEGGERPVLEANGVRLAHGSDPREEARKWAGEQSWGEISAFLVMGAGSGYHLEALGERLGVEQVMLVVEERKEIWEHLLAVRDLSSLWRTRQVIPCWGGAPATVEQAILSRFEFFFRRAWAVVEYGPALALDGRAYRPLVERLTGFISFHGINFNTKDKKGRFQLSNHIQDFHPTAAFSSPEPYRGWGRGQAALCVSAGPSLDRNFSVVAKHGSALVLAADTLSQRLAATGIATDFIISCDPLFVNWQHSFSFHPPRAGRLVCPDDTYPLVLKKLPLERTIVVPGDKPFSDWVARRLGPATALAPLISVGHLAFAWAMHLGCSPILLAGYDFSFPTSRAHAVGLEEAWTRNQIRNHLSLQVEDVYGGKVATTPDFLCYRDLLAEQIAKSAVPVIDATEGGIRIAGTTVMSLREALARYASSSRPARSWPVLPPAGGSRLALGRETLRQLETLAVHCAQAEEELRVLTGREGGEREAAKDRLNRLAAAVFARQDLLGMLSEDMMGTMMEMKRIAQCQEFAALRRAPVEPLEIRRFDLFFRTLGALLAWVVPLWGVALETAEGTRGD